MDSITLKQREMEKCGSGNELCKVEDSWRFIIKGPLNSQGLLQDVNLCHILFGMVLLENLKKDIMIEYFK